MKKQHLYLLLPFITLWVSTALWEWVFQGGDSHEYWYGFPLCVWVMV